ncbi:inositol-3-phosphate synthase [Pedobacter gandavensis]|uniref:Uncharacterized protein n=1 Tax=Pedobacter gandavensis TaxID=2679963 RepID=A0ABR6F0J6_9SPHI|nr:hypothetical protein [Pedobacter gandavensis]MBB2150554.1 hypothetical protein [Pedobacter gandavensis]
MIDVIDFKQSVIDVQVPPELPSYMQALWYDGIGDWKTAHDLIDQLTDQRSAHIHAYLHRKEGDIWNADYWYKRAGKTRPQVSLAEEWEMLVKEYCR